jgi:hypothetical protein
LDQKVSGKYSQTPASDEIRRFIKVYSLPELKMSRFAAAILLGAVSSLTRAAPEEIQVYMDEMNTPGEFVLIFASD